MATKQYTIYDPATLLGAPVDVPAGTVVWVFVKVI